MVSAKGKEKATDSDGKGKRKWTADDDKTGRKRKYPGVAQYIDISAYRDDKGEDSSEDSSEDFSDDSGYDSGNWSLENEIRDVFLFIDCPFSAAFACIRLILCFLGESTEMWVS